MKVLSINVGLPRDVAWRGRTVRTSIWKDPVSGPVRVGQLNLDGDRQTDLTVHGGAFKAVYGYPSEHYATWRDELGVADLPMGAFGENLTTQGLLEDSLEIGTHLTIGSAEFMVTQPRMPCFKLAVRFDRPDILKRLLKSRRSGFYFSVVREGTIESGDAIERVAGTGQGVTVRDIVSLYVAEPDDVDLSRLRRAIAAPALPAMWKDHFSSLL